MAMYRKIYKGEFKCPPWFSSSVVKLVSRLLDPNPRTRITIPRLMEVPWFRKGFKADRPASHDDVDDDIGLADVDSAFEFRESSKANQELKTKPALLNAFDIICFSPRFNLSGFFKDKAVKQGSRFTSTQSASTIMSKLEEVAKLFQFSVKKKGDCKVKLQGSKQGRKGHLAISAKIFEVTPSLFVVEVSKAGGDTL